MIKVKFTKALRSLSKVMWPEGSAAAAAAGRICPESRWVKYPWNPDVIQLNDSSVFDTVREWEYLLVDC